MVLINLFFAFLRIGLFAFGGAYSFLPLLEKEIVQRYNWLSKKEFLDVLGMTKVFPGAISIKYATYTGFKIGGIWGALFANLGNILAPMLLVIFASVFYFRYKDFPILKSAFATIQLVVFALILAVAFQVVDIHSLISLKSIFIIIVAFTIFIYTNIHPAIIILFAGILGVIWR